MRNYNIYNVRFLNPWIFQYIMTNSTSQQFVRTAGVMVSCKIPILATRVRFPGGATFSTRVKFLIVLNFNVNAMEKYVLN